jgi:hypothetical protein
VFGISVGGGTVTVAGTAIGGSSGAGIVTGGNGASVSLLNAVGGATTGTLNLTQTAIGGNGGFSAITAGLAGNASSTLVGINPYGSTNYNLYTYAIAGTEPTPTP